MRGGDSSCELIKEKDVSLDLNFIHFPKALSFETRSPFCFPWANDLDDEEVCERDSADEIDSNKFRIQIKENRQRNNADSESNLRNFVLTHFHTIP